MSGSRHKLKSIKAQDIHDCASYILDEFEDSLGARITFADSNSAKIKFSEPKLGTLRIANYSIEPSYLSRWNIYVGNNIPAQGKYKSHWYRIDKAHKFVKRLPSYLEGIAKNSETSTLVDIMARTSQVSLEEVTNYDDQDNYYEELSGHCIGPLGQE
jgi:hypothetical protein